MGIKLFFQFLLILIYYMTLILSQNVILETSYTRGFLTKLEEKIECHIDEECPEFSKCQNDYCIFSNFLCLENKETNCFFLNTTLWEDNEQVLSNPFHTTTTKPIIKSCPKELLSKKQCQTEECEKNEDCFSGSCFLQSCATKETVYLCTGTEETEKNPIHCGKYQHMPCKKDEECTQPFKCKDGYCESYWYKSSYHRTNWKLILIWCILGVALFLIILYIMWLIQKIYQNKKEKEMRNKLMINNAFEI